MILIISSLHLFIVYNYLRYLQISGITYNDFRFQVTIKFMKIIGTLSSILLGLYFTNKFGLIIGNYFGQITYIFNFILFKNRVIQSIKFKSTLSIIKNINFYSQSTSHLIEVLHTLLFSILIVQKLNLKELGYLYFIL